MNVIQYIHEQFAPESFFTFPLEQNEALDFLPDVFYFVKSGAVSDNLSTKVRQTRAIALYGSGESPTLNLLFEKVAPRLRRCALTGESKYAEVWGKPAHEIRNAWKELPVEVHNELLKDITYRMSMQLIEIRRRTAFFHNSLLLQRLQWFEDKYDPICYLEEGEVWSNLTLVRQLWADKISDIQAVRNFI